MDSLINFILGSADATALDIGILVRYMAFVLVLSCIASIADSAINGARR